MKQYTTPEQTAKLIELGFEKPKSIEVYRDGHCVPFVEQQWAYSIGELIEMLPRLIHRLYCRNIIGSSVKYSFDDPFGNTPALYHFLQNRELIDNLFEAVVELKEEGVI